MRDRSLCFYRKYEEIMLQCPLLWPFEMLRCVPFLRERRLMFDGFQKTGLAWQSSPPKGSDSKRHSSHEPAEFQKEVLPILWNLDGGGTWMEMTPSLPLPSDRCITLFWNQHTAARPMALHRPPGRR